MTLSGSVGKATTLVAVVLLVTSMTAPTIAFAQTGAGNTSAAGNAGNASALEVIDTTELVDIESPNGQATAEFSFRASEGLLFDATDEGEATVRIDLAGAGPNLSLAPDSATITFARSVGVGNTGAETAVSLGQSEEELTVTIDESDASLSQNENLEVSLEADLSIANGATPSHTLSYEYVPSTGENQPQALVLGASTSPALDGLPARLAPDSRITLGVSGGGYPAVAVYARDGGDWQLLELDGNRKISLSENDRATLSSVSLSGGDAPGNTMLDTPGGYRVAVVGQSAGTTPEESRAVVSDDIATAYFVSVPSPPEAGTAANPYIIDDVEGLQAISDDLHAHYKLGSDIDASATATWNIEDGQAKGFEPVGTDEQPFRGSLDGGGHSIDGLTIQRDSWYAGLFGVTGGATITNATLNAASVDGDSYYAGILAGELVDTTVRNVAVGGHVSGTSNVGGFAGGADHGGIIINSVSTAEIDGTRHVGGLFGAIDETTISNVSATGDVKGEGGNDGPYGDAGGLVGYVEGTPELTDVRATGAVEGNGRVGGLVGSSTGKIENGSASGTVSGGEGVGGLVGYSLGQITNSTAEVQVTGAERVGGVVGALGRIDPNKRPPKLEVFVVNSDATGDVDGERYVGGLVGWRAQDAANETSSATGTVTATGESGPVLGNDDQVASWRGQSQRNAAVLEEMAGSGTPADPYRIGDQRELQAMAADLDASYKLSTDIQLDSSNAPVSADENSGNFLSIGDTESQFSGNLDGDGHKISNLSVHQPDLASQGMFGHINDSVLQDLHLENASVKGYTTAGLVAARAENTRFENISVNGTVETEWSMVGGIAGRVTGGKIVNVSTDVTLSGTVMIGGVAGLAYTNIQDAQTSGTVTAINNGGGVVGRLNQPAKLENVSSDASVEGWRTVGGLVGVVHGTVANSTASGDVMGTKAASNHQRGVGGLAGAVDGRIENSTATGDVEGVDHVGGLVGYAEGILSRSTAEGAVTGESAVGGLVGTLEAESPSSSAEIRDSTSKGDVSGTTLVGGVAGSRGEYATNTSNRALGAVTGDGRVGDRFGNANQISQWIARQETNTGQLAMMAGSGSPADPYIITDARQLQAMAADRSAAYRLGADVDASGTASWNDALGSAKGFAPIGETHAPFNGSLDGNGHSITGLTITRADEGNVGLFGYSHGATIKNLSIMNIEVVGLRNVGGLVGENLGDGTSVANVTISGSVKGSDHYVGGVAGQFVHGSLNDINTQTAVSGEGAVGGLVGDAGRVTIESSSVSGSTKSSRYTAGGVAGVGSAVVVRDTSVAGSVDGYDRTGGILGHGDAGSVIRNTTVTATVSGSHDIGGLVGQLKRGAVYDSTVEGAVDGNTRVGGIVGHVDEGSVEDSISSRSVTGEKLVGGAVGKQARAAEISGLEATGQLTADGSSGAIVGNEDQLAIWRTKDAAREKKLDELETTADQETPDPSPSNPPAGTGGGSAGSAGGASSGGGVSGGGGSAPTVALPPSMPSPAPTEAENSTEQSLNATDSALPDAENQTAAQATNTTESAPTEGDTDEPPNSGEGSGSDLGSTEGDAQTPTESEPPVEETPGPSEAEESNVERVFRVVSELIGNVRQALFG
jgi:hypothetical protein